MKNIFLTQIFCLVTYFSFSQQADIPKNAYKSIVNNTKTASENFLFAKGLLAGKGIEIANVDKDVLQISSGSIGTKDFRYFF